MVVDLVMTGLTGVDTVQLARRARPDLKVLYCSGYADMSRFKDHIGNEVLLKKPFRRDTLAEAVRTILQPLVARDAHNIVPLRRSELS
jgi:two-component system, cell cycle sensor histidine kinase and response regulator CckA